MKKSILLLIPVLALAGCSGESPIVEQTYLFSHRGALPVVEAASDSEHTTYLMMSKYGYLSVQGQDVYPGTLSEKFVENVIEWKTAPGAELPSPSSVHSKVNGATFRGWAQYNGNVSPDYLIKVPEKSGEFVYAIFDGTPGGGGGGGGEATKVTLTVTNMPTWVKDDGCIIFAWVWGATDNGSWAELNYTSDTSGTFEALTDTSGFLLARCKAGTTTPDWNIHDDSVGRVYNQTEDISVTVGVTSYPCSDWKEYH